MIVGVWLKNFNLKVLAINVNEHEVSMGSLPRVHLHNFGFAFVVVAPLADATFAGVVRKTYSRLLSWV
jgi:hypothetical protein